MVTTQEYILYFLTDFNRVYSRMYLLLFHRLCDEKKSESSRYPFSTLNYGNDNLFFLLAWSEKK